MQPDYNSYNLHWETVLTKPNPITIYNTVWHCTSVCMINWPTSARLTVLSRKRQQHWHLENITKQSLPTVSLYINNRPPCCLFDVFSNSRVTNSTISVIIRQHSYLRSNAVVRLSWLFISDELENVLDPIGKASKPNFGLVWPWPLTFRTYLGHVQQLTGLIGQFIGQRYVRPVSCWTTFIVIQ